MLFEKFIVNTYQSTLCTRYDGSPLLSYFGVGDFEGLMREGHTFRGDRGQILQGYFYFYGERRTDRLTVFDHGMGAGHNAYMKEIERLCRAGHTVFAYDHTGCMESEGAHIVGFAQSLNDLDHALRAIRALAEYKGAALSVIGHSWGGFATLNIPALHPDVASCVALSGFIGVGALVDQLFSGMMRPYRRAILAAEREANPYYSTFDARQSLADTNTRVLVVHSVDDATVKSKFHFDPLQKALFQNTRVRFLRVEGKGHNPNYTAEAVAYLGEMNAALQKGFKKKAFSTEEAQAAFCARWDWHKMTEQDEALWKTVLDFLADDGVAQ